MPRRSKKRTHVGADNPTHPEAHGHASGLDPKSMVIRIGAGKIGASLSQLVTDVRRVMEPGTASRLKERRANRLKDYVVMTGPLGVTHLMLFSRSSAGNTNLRIALAPRGPTLNFHVEQYSLAKDVQRVQRHPRGVGRDYLTPPLLVMNNFTTPTATASTPVPKQLEALVTTVFQSLFPPINPQTTPLRTIRRVLLLNRERPADGEDEPDGSFVVDFRHYAITTRTAGMSRQLRRLEAAEKLAAPRARRGGVPDLGGLRDVADFMADDGGFAFDLTSASEPDTDNEVEVLEPIRVKAGAARPVALEDAVDAVERRAVRLVELGPRMRLRLHKVEEGLCAGRIMWHEYVQKSRQEVRELDERWESRRRLKETRRREQRANVDRKSAAVPGDGEDSDSDDQVDYDYDHELDGVKAADAEHEHSASSDSSDGEHGGAKL